MLSGRISIFAKDFSRSHSRKSATVPTVPTQERKHNSTLMLKVPKEARSAILAPGQNHLLLQRAEKLAAVARGAAGRADEAGAMEQAVLTALRESGLTFAMFPPAFRGAGLGDFDQQTTLCTILRIIGAADLSLARLFEGHTNAVMLVSRYGIETQIVALADDVRRGGLYGGGGEED